MDGLDADVVLSILIEVLDDGSALWPSDKECRYDSLLHRRSLALNLRSMGFLGSRVYRV